MKEYFLLRYRMTCRNLSEFGMAPGLAFPLVAAVFTGFSLALFRLSPYPWPVYITLALSLISRFSEEKRNEFLASVFPRFKYRILRITENLLTVLPFTVFLLLWGSFTGFAMLLALAFTLALTRFRAFTTVTLPTPFSRHPFEFPSGFRNTFYLFVIAWGLSAVAGPAGNFNLSVFALLVVFVTAFTFYLRPENDYLVWSFSGSPARFLWRKIAAGLVCSFLLCVPVMLFTAFFFPGQMAVLVMFQILGHLFLAMAVLAKYAAWPREINLPEMLLIVLPVLFPPLIVVAAPYLCTRAVRRVKPLLV